MAIGLPLQRYALVSKICDVVSIVIFYSVAIWEFDSTSGIPRLH